MATISNIYIDRGSDYTSIVTVVSATGLPLDLSGYVAKSQIRKSYNSSQSFTFTATIYSAPSGQIKLALSAAETELIPAGRWLYDVEITHTATGMKKRVVEGIVEVTPQITQI